MSDSGRLTWVKGSALVAKPDEYLAAGAVGGALMVLEGGKAQPIQQDWPCRRAA